MKQHGGPTLSMQGAPPPHMSHTLPMTHRSQFGGGAKSARFGGKSVGGGSFFAPSLSTSSFFTRHNPHPGRVRHIKGLLDVPICHVSDDGFAPQQPRPILTPERRSIYQSQKYPMPAVSQHPVFPSNSYDVDTYDVFHTKGIPFRKVPTLPHWLEELKGIGHRAGLESAMEGRGQGQGKPATGGYSKTTGRLNEAPSRAMSRQPSRTGRQASRSGIVTGAVSKFPDNEALIMEMLCQILQTDSLSAVQQWLCSSDEREKDLACDMIKAALVSDVQASSQPPAQFVDGDYFLTGQGDKPASGGPVDRLVVDQGQGEPTRLPDIQNPQPASQRFHEKPQDAPGKFDHLEPVMENDQEFVEYRYLDNSGQQ